MRNEVVSYLEQQGFTQEFTVSREGLIDPLSRRPLDPRRITVRRIFQFEGSGSSGGMDAVYAVMTDNGRRGWVSAPRFGVEGKAFEALLSRMRGVHRSRK